jgi:predicted dehydrogenase
MSKPKIAVVGAGLIGRRHIELVADTADCELSAIVEPAESAVELAASLQVARYADLGSLIDDKPVDGVILATPNQLHYEQALACIDANLPVLIEKPIAETVQQAQHIVARVDETGARVIVGHHRMHSSIMQQAREIISSGVIGDIVAVQGAALFYKPDDYFAAGPWRTKAGGGPILINMIHEVGNLRYLCGEIIEVQAMPSSATRGFEVEDTVGILLRFDSGAIGTFLLSDTAASCKSWEQTARENLSYHHDQAENCYHIAGTRGSLSVPTMTLHRFDDNTAPSWWNPMNSIVDAVDVVDPLQRQLKHFCAVIRGEEQPIVSAADGCRNLQITEQISRACNL